MGFTENVDAAFLSDKHNKLYILKGHEYARVEFKVGQGASMDGGYSKEISN
jgi:hypothetical protein